MAILLNMLLIFFISLFLLVIALIILPVKYFFNGGYKDGFYSTASIGISPLGKIIIIYENKFMTKVKLLGFTFKLDSGRKTGKQKKAPRGKDDRKNKLGIKGYKEILQKDNLSHIFSLIQDLFMIMRPKLLLIKARIGFEEPHQTAWMQAFISSISELDINAHINVETVWDEECYEGEIRIEGNFILFIILVRLLRFIVSKKALKIWSAIRKEGKSKKQIATEH